MKIEAWLCEHCSSISRDEESYVKCKNQCEKKLKDAASYKKKSKEFERLANSLRLEIEDINDVPKLLKKFFKDNYNRTVEITLFSLNFSDSVSNSHNCPIDGTTNWGGRVDGAPRGYPGWSGRIEGHTDLYNKPIKHPLTKEKLDSFSDVVGDRYRALVKGFNTGTGGSGGGDKFGYSVELFLNDFPKLKKYHQEFLKLSAAHRAYEEIHKKLKAEAITKLIEEDEKYKGFRTYEQVLKILVDSNAKKKSERYNQIVNSPSFKDYIAVPKEYNFDSKRYVELVEQFKGR